MFLSKEEVEALTGAKHKRKQKEWLDRNGFSYRVGLDGKIKLLRVHVEEVLNPSTRPRKKTPTPDFSKVVLCR